MKSLTKLLAMRQDVKLVSTFLLSMHLGQYQKFKESVGRLQLPTMSYSILIKKASLYQLFFAAKFSNSLGWRLWKNKKYMKCLANNKPSLLMTKFTKKMFKKWKTKKPKFWKCTYKERPNKKREGKESNLPTKKQFAAKFLRIFSLI